MSQVAPAVPHTANSDSTSNAKVQAAAGHRAKVGHLNLPAKQSVSLNSDLQHGITIFPSSGTPAWGSYFTIDLKSPNLLIHNITLQFNLGAVTGSSPVGYFNPAWFFFTRIELVQGGNVIKTIHGNQQFLKNQLFEWDEDRCAINAAAGPYNNTTVRTALSSTSTTNTLYANLRTYFDEIGGVPLLNEQHAVQIRVYMDTLTNVFKLSSGTLTSVAINSVNAICKTTKLDPVTANNQLMAMSAHPFHHIFHDNVYFPYSVPSGVATSTTVLAGITGNVSALYFTIRANIVTDQAWVYTQFASFAIQDNTGTNIVGGQVVPATLAANLLNKDWCKSSYFNETSFGVTDNKANFYCWAFSADIIDAVSHGKCLSSRKFSGQETLVLNWASSLGAAVQVDCYALVESVLEMSPSSVKKLVM